MIDLSKDDLILNHLPGMAYRCEVSPPWRLQYVSAGVRLLTGYESEDFTRGGVSWADLVHPDDLPLVEKEVGDAVASRSAFSVRYRINDPAIGVRWVRERGEAVYGPADQPIAIVGFVMDVTAQRNAEERLRQADERYTLAARATGEAIWDWNSETDVTEWLWPDGEGLGYGQIEETSGTWWQERVHPEDRDRVLHSLERAVSGFNDRWTERYRLRKADGTYAHVLDQGFLFTTGASQHRMVGALKDISVSVAARSEIGRLQAESLRMANEQRALLELTVENVREGVVLVDGEFRVLSWNEAFCEFFGYPRELVRKGMSAGELIKISAEQGDLGPGEPSALVAELLSSIGSSASRRMEIQRANGTILDVWRKTIEGGYFILTARDATDERKASRLKDELVATVSHELRTPLTSISGALKMMDAGAAGELPEKAKKLLGIAQGNSDRLIKIVNDLLDIDKLESGRAEFAFEPTDLVILLETAVEHNRPYAEKFGVRLRLEVLDQPLVVHLDPHRILQLAANLISNAAKFSPEGETVTIHLKEQEGMALLLVTDLGPGIPEKFQPLLFTRFARADGASNRMRDGTGLGLAIAKSIVEHHGGTINFETSPQGTRFQVALPLVR